VNFTDPKRARTPKASATYYRSIIEDNGFPLPMVTGLTPSRTTNAAKSQPQHSNGIEKLGVTIYSSFITVTLIVLTKLLY